MIFIKVQYILNNLEIFLQTLARYSIYILFYFLLNELENSLDTTHLRSKILDLSKALKRHVTPQWGFI